MEQTAPRKLNGSAATERDQVLSWVEGPDTEQGQASGQTFSKQQALSVASDIINQGG